MEPGIVEYEDEEGDEVEPPAVRIGLLLDFDARSLTVYKNGVRLGNMVDGHWGENGPMEGQYSWALSTRRQGAHFERMELCSRPLASGNSRLRLLLSTVTKDEARHQEIASRSKRRVRCTSTAAMGELLSLCGLADHVAARARGMRSRLRTSSKLRHSCRQDSRHELCRSCEGTWRLA